ncbi:MAG: protein kinase family protein [Candidatus Nitrosocosmicus sp.]|nr:tetratricopeptide repeat-containing serine/threonine-protein kinase [Candidatus Nitrosocosmicus sp.]
MNLNFPPSNNPTKSILEWNPGEIVPLFESLQFERIDNESKGGAFGKLYKVKELNLGITMAAKSPGEGDEHIQEAVKKEAFMREAYALLTLPPHPNVVESYIVTKVKDKFYIFMEFMDGGNLLDYLLSLSNSSTKNWRLIYSIIYQIAEGLRFIHSKGLVHKDLKHNNILLKNDDRISVPIVKIADFGLSSFRDPAVKRDLRIESENNKYNDQSNDQNIKSNKKENNFDFPSAKLFYQEYASPELEKAIHIDGKITGLTDIFTFGIVVLELLTQITGFKSIINYYDFLSPNAQISRPEDIEKANSILQQQIDSFLKGNGTNIDPRFSDILKKCMEVNPKNRYQNFEEVIEAMNNITEKFKKDYGVENHIPSSPEILFYGLRGLSLIELNFENKGMELYNYAISLPCKNIADHNNKGVILLENKRFDEAIAEFDNIISIDPSYIDAYISKSAIYNNTSRHLEAVKECDKAIGINPNDHLPFHNRGNAFKHLGNYSEAISSYEKALQNNPNYVKSLINKAICHCLLEQFELARLDVNKALKIDPWDTSIYRLRDKIESEINRTGVSIT